MALDDHYETPHAELTYSDRPDFAYTPLELARSPAQGAAERELSAWGLDPDWVGEDPFGLVEFGEQGGFRRYQYDTIYGYVRRQGDALEYFPVEFRVWIHTVGEIPDSLKLLFKDRDNPRLQYLFDSGPYEGHMTGFEFQVLKEMEEDDEIAADEADNLGIPQFEVIVHQGGSVVGHAGGFFDPFALFERIPEQEEWDITKNDARSEYEFRPQGRARQRLEGEDKQVYLNGRYIGNITPTRGTAALSFDYSSNDNTWKNTKTGRQMWSREKFLNEDFFTPQAVRKGSKVYKTGEDEDAIVLVATKPDEWDPAPEAAIPTSPDESLTMGRADETTFDIRFDDGYLLGRYDTPMTRDIGRATDLLQA